MVSIIIPAYNAEKYIRRCIVSCMCQSYRDFEIIVVNDGSTDNTQKELEILDQEIEMLHIHEIPNGGVTHARNVGARSAKGEWLFFLDCDDTLPENGLEKLMRVSKNNDLVIGNFRYVDQDGLLLSENFNNYPESLTTRNVLKSILHFKMTGNLWGKLIRKELFLSIDLPPETIFIGEDIICGLQIVEGADSIETVDDFIYNYYQYPNSTINSNHPVKVASMIEYMRFVRSFIKEKYPELEKESSFFLLNEYFAYLMYGGEWKEGFEFDELYKQIQPGQLALPLRLLFKSYSVSPKVGFTFLILLRRLRKARRTLKNKL